MTDLETKLMQALDAQIALRLKQAPTKFRKVGAALVGVTAAMVQALDICFGG